MHGGCWLGQNRQGLSVPGWSKEVKPYKDASLYWGNLRKSSGRPNRGWAHGRYTDARRQYHHAILRVRRQCEQHQAEELLTAAMEGDVHLLRAMKNIRKGGRTGAPELPDTVGGAAGEENIAEMFKESYESFYNSAPTELEMTEIKTHMENLIDVASKEEVWKVSGDSVKAAVDKLKPNKSDVSGSYVSDALNPIKFGI